MNDAMKKLDRYLSEAQDSIQCARSLCSLEDISEFEDLKLIFAELGGLRYRIKRGEPNERT